MAAVGRHTIVSGLDIGTSKVTCLVGEINQENHIEITGKGTSPSQGVKKGIVVDIGETVKSIQQAVREAERSSGFKIHSVFVNVTGEHIASINSHGIITLANEAKEITEEDMRRSIEAAKVVSLPADREVIHVIPRGFAVDGQNGIKNPVGMLGMKLEANTHIVTGTVTFLHNLTKCVELAGLEIEENGMVLQPLASSLSVLNDAEKELGIILLDIGGGTTDLAIFRNKHIYHTSVLPVGGYHITNDLAVAFKLSPTEAERIKIEFGHADPSQILEDEAIEVTTLSGVKESISRKAIAEKISPRIEEIFALVKTEMDKAAREFSLAGLILTGGTSLLPGLSTVAKQILKLPIRVGYPLPLNGSVNDAIHNPQYSTGVGLLVYAGKNLNSQKVYRKRESFLARMFRNLFKDFF